MPPSAFQRAQLARGMTSRITIQTSATGQGRRGDPQDVFTPVDGLVDLPAAAIPIDNPGDPLMLAKAESGTRDWRFKLRFPMPTLPAPSLVRVAWTDPSGKTRTLRVIAPTACNTDLEQWSIDCRDATG